MHGTLYTPKFTAAIIMGLSLLGHLSRFTVDFHVFLYMDIIMWQQMINKIFAPDPGSALYRDTCDIMMAQLHCEEVDSTWAAIRSWEMSQPQAYASRHDWEYVPYPAPSNYDGCRLPYRFDTLNSSAEPPGAGGRGSFQHDSSHPNSFCTASSSQGQRSAPKICLKCGKQESHYASDCNASTIHAHPD